MPHIDFAAFLASFKSWTSFKELAVTRPCKASKISARSYLLVVARPVVWPHSKVFEGQECDTPSLRTGARWETPSFNQPRTRLLLATLICPLTGAILLTTQYHECYQDHTVIRTVNNAKRAICLRSAIIRSTMWSMLLHRGGHTLCEMKLLSLVFFIQVWHSVMLVDFTSTLVIMEKIMSLGDIATVFIVSP